AALVLGGHGEIGLGEALADGALGVAAPTGRAAGGEAGRAGADSQGGEQAATGGGERPAGHVGGSWEGGGTGQGRGGRRGRTGGCGRGADLMAPAARPPVMRCWARKKRISIGRETNTAPAMITPQLL